MSLLANAALLAALATGTTDRSAEEPLCIDVEVLRSGEWSDELPELCFDALVEVADWAAALGLNAYVVEDPALVLFSAGSERDVCWTLSLLRQAASTFAEKYLVEGRSPRHALTAFHFTEDTGYQQLLTFLEEEFAYLQEWIPQARQVRAYALYQPTLVAVCDRKNGKEVDNCDNLLVHAAGHLALHQYFGVQPIWVREAASMDLEVTLLDKVSTPCGVNDFVPERRRGGWRTDVGKAWRSQTGASIQEVLGLRHGHYDYRAALRALGLLRHLLREHTERLGQFLLQLEADRLANLRSDPYYLPDAETQRDLLATTLGEDWDRGMLKTLARSERKKSSSIEVRTQQQLDRARKIARRRPRSR